MEPALESGTIISKVKEAHDLVEKLRAEIFAGEEKRIRKTVLHRLLFYFLIAFMAGAVVGIFYMNSQTDYRLAMARRIGVLALSDGTMFELTPVAPKHEVVVVKK